MTNLFILERGTLRVLRAETWLIFYRTIATTCRAGNSSLEKRLVELLLSSGKARGVMTRRVEVFFLLEE